MQNPPVPHVGAPARRLLPLLVTLVAACSDGDGEPASGSRAPGATGAPAGRSTPEQAARSQVPRTAAEVFESGVQAALRGRFEEAVERYRRAIQIDPNLAEAHHALGRALVPSSWVIATGARDNAVLDEALEHLGRAAELDPENADYFYWKGRVLDLRGRDEDALAALRRAVEIDPTHGLAHKRIGLLLTDRGETEAAKASFLAAMEHLPEDAGVPFQYGNLLFDEDPAAARVQYERAIAIDATFPWAYQKLAQVLARLGDAEGARAAEEKFATWKGYDDQLRAAARRADNNRDDREAQVAAAELYYAAGRMDEALAMFRRALVLDPVDPLVHLYCGKIMLGLEEYEVAMNHLEESAFLAPEDPLPKLELVRLYALTDNDFRVKELIEELDQAFGSTDAARRLELANLLAEVGRDEEAAREYAALLEQDPNDAEARAGLERTGATRSGSATPGGEEPR